MIDADGRFSCFCDFTGEGNIPLPYKSCFLQYMHGRKIIAQIKCTFNDCLFTSLCHNRRACSVSTQQGNRINQDGLTGTCFTSKGTESFIEIQCEFFNQYEVLNVEISNHNFSSFSISSISVFISICSSRRSSLSLPCCTYTSGIPILCIFNDKFFEFVYSRIREPSP